MPILVCCPNGSMAPSALLTAPQQEKTVQSELLHTLCKMSTETEAMDLIRVARHIGDTIFTIIIFCGQATQVFTPIHATCNHRYYNNTAHQIIISRTTCLLYPTACYPSPRLFSSY